MSYVLGVEDELDELTMNGLNKNLFRFVTIGREYWDVPVRVELRPYLAFNRRMNWQLRHLVGRWAKYAAPVSLRVHRKQRR